MFKNIIISILVVSNVVFLVFAMNQKQLADKMVIVAEVAREEEIAKTKMVVEAQAELMTARQTADSLVNELAKISK